MMTALPLDETHDPQARSWVDSANTANTDFPIQNLPFGVFVPRGSSEPGRIGVAIGDQVLDLPACHAAGVFEGACVAEGGACTDVSLNALMALGPTHWRALRRRLHGLLRAGHPEEARHREVVGPRLVPAAEVQMRLPAQVGDYTDASLYWALDFTMLLAATMVLSIFATAVVPLCISVCFSLLGASDPHAFGHTRVWGTVGFLVAVVSFPAVLDALRADGWVGRTMPGATEPGLEIMLPVTALLTIVAAGIAILLPDRPIDHDRRMHAGEWRTLLTHGPFVRFLLFIVGAYLFLQGPTSLFPLFVRSLGGDMDSGIRLRGTGGGMRWSSPTAESATAPPKRSASRAPTKPRWRT